MSSGTGIVDGLTAASPGAGAKLFDQLSAKHPDYAAAEELWTLFRDILGDEEPDKRKYLPQGVQENDSIYALRIKLAEWVPTSVLSCDKLVGALTRQEPKRDWGSLTDDLSGVAENADRKGTSWSALMGNEVLRSLVGFGSTRLLVNQFNPIAAANPGGGATPERPRGPTAADVKAAGARPFLVNYSPLSVIDWEVDEAGTLAMVRIKESRIARSRKYPGDRSRKATITRFIEYNRQDCEWWTFLEDSGAPELDGAASGSSHHGLGIVPMIVAYYPRMIKPMVGRGFLRFAAKADLRKIRAVSDLGYDAHLHAHPLLWVRTRRDLGLMGIGASSYVKLDPDELNSAIGYVDVPASAFDANLKVIDLNDKAIVHHTGIDPLGMLQAGTSAFQTSGTARAWSFETSEGRILAALAKVMTDVERQAAEICARYLRPGESAPGDKLFDGEIQYAKEFDSGATSSLLGDLQSVMLTINTPTGIRAIQKRAMTALVGDAPHDVQQSIQDEIDENDLINTAAGRTQEPTDMPPYGYEPGADAGADAEAETSTTAPARTTTTPPPRGRGRG